MLLCRISCSFTTSKPLLHHQLHFLAFQRLFRVLLRSTTATEIRLLRLLQQSVAMRLILLLILHRREGLPCQTRFMVLQALRSPSLTPRIFSLSLTPRIFFGWVDRYQYLHTLLLWWAHSLCQSLPKVRNLEKKTNSRIFDTVNLSPHRVAVRHGEEKIPHASLHSREILSSFSWVCFELFDIHSIDPFSMIHSDSDPSFPNPPVNLSILRPSSFVLSSFSPKFNHYYSLYGE